MRTQMKEIKSKRQAHIPSKANYKLTDMFRHYEYKDIDTTKVQGRNWVKKDEIVSNHKYSATLAEWKEIITAYFDVVLDKLIQGEDVILPYGWGTLYMVRWKKKNITVMGGFLRFYWSEKCLQKVKNSLDNNRFLINNYLKL